MKRIEILSTTDAFRTTFKDCCQRYDHLDMYVAWVGNPGNSFPLSYLEELSSVHAVVGIAFAQSNPDGIAYLMQLDENLRIAKESKLFHPKVYVFSSSDSVAILIGSSNLTYSGFYENIEVNLLLEDHPSSILLKPHLESFRKWDTDECSFTPSRKWLTDYRKRYLKRQENLILGKTKDESTKENEYAMAASWLTHADWNLFLEQLIPAIQIHETRLHLTWEQKMDLLNTYKEVFRHPWSLVLFDDIENRRMLNGLRPHEWLGHVGASGHARQLLANSPIETRQTVVDVMNQILQMRLPLDWDVLRGQLQILEALGPTMKVWSRYLTISRPEVFGTIASESVRRNLATLLEVSDNYFASAEGYVHFLQRLHSSPWFNAPEPQDEFQRSVWSNRMALLDIIFY